MGAIKIHPLEKLKMSSSFSSLVDIFSKRTEKKFLCGKSYKEKKSIKS